MKEFIGSPFEQESDNEEDFNELEFVENIPDAEIFFDAPPNEHLNEDNLYDSHDDDSSYDVEDDPDYILEDMNIDDSSSVSSYHDFLDSDGGVVETDQSEERELSSTEAYGVPFSSEDENWDKDELDYVTFPVDSPLSIEVSSDRPNGNSSTTQNQEE
ncbi:uncharacterized protein [Euwallacea similis]|uniref:uncharacterized protein n=1 Tax=Euwallacea similis TaxID=1736056 RepID=UPI003450F0A9